MIFPQMSEVTKQYWTENDFQDLQNAETIQDVFKVAQRVISRMPDTLAQVCGPVTSGGKGSIEENLKHFSHIIKELQEQSFHIFDQMPFEETFQRIAYSKTSSQHHDDILSNFYEPIFLLGKIKALYFIPGWETSKGSNWEYAKGQELGLEIRLL